MKNLKHFSYSFESSKKENEVFQKLLDIKKWWTGLYGEKIKGTSKKLNDEFSFSAGEGAHYSKQKLVELIPGKKIAWLVTDSDLSFLHAPDEWVGTKIIFDISKKGNKTKITFTHEGLVPKIECYGACSGAWTEYLKKLEANLK